VLAAPLTVVAGLGMAAGTPLLHGLGMASEGLGQCSICVALSAALGYTAGRAMVRRESPGVIYRRGAIVTDVAHAASAVDRSHHRSREPRLDGITLAGLPVTAEDEVKHFKLIGATGTG